MYQSEIDRRADEAEATARGLDPHGEMNTPEHMRQFEQDMKKYNVAGVKQ